MFESKLKLVYDNNLADLAEETARELGRGQILNSNDAIKLSVEQSNMATSQFHVEMSSEASDLIATYDEQGYSERYMHDSDEIIPSLAVDEIAVSGGYSLKDALTMIKDLHLGLGTELYGVILKSTSRNDKRFNPLHPLIAAKLQYEIEHDIRMDKRYKLIVYTTKKRKFITKSSSDYVKSEIIRLVMAATKSITTTKICTDFQRSGDNLGYAERIVDSNGNPLDGSNNSDTYSIIPAHICGSGGLAYPYYGTVMIKRYTSGGIGGKNMSPMLSANLAEPYEGEWSSICTGEESSNTDRGLQTLNHSNLASPMNSNTWNDDCYAYVQSCIETSLEVFFGNYRKEFEDGKKKQTEQMEQEKTQTEGARDEHIEEHDKQGTTEQRNDESDRDTDGQASRSVVDDTEIDSTVPGAEWDEWAL